MLHELMELDEAAYAAVAAVPTPTLDRALGRLSRAANWARVWLAAAAALTVADGRAGRTAAADGLAAVACTSVLVNAGAKLVGRRPRPDRVRYRVPVARQVPMPRSGSFPSGHAASAFAFATAAGNALPAAALPLRALAAAVAYSRVHTGVHYPLDVVAGALAGGATGTAISAVAARRRRGGAAVAAYIRKTP